MTVLFLSISSAVSDINNRGIYPDLCRYFAQQGHQLFIVCPFERRFKKKSTLSVHDKVSTLGVKTLNITKSNMIEKGIATLLIEFQFKKAIKKYFRGVKFDLILYTTPPITFNNIIKELKQEHNSITYLMLKDIFPQNALDLGLIKSNSFLYRMFRKKEKELYTISDFIGCMSQGNVDYLIEHEPSIDQSKVGICPNAIEISDRFSNLNRDFILDKYSIPKDRTILIYGGNLGIAQGIPFLVEVLKSNKDREEVFFIIVGSGNKDYLIQNWINDKHPLNVKFIPMLNRSDYDLLEASCDIGMIFLDKRFTIPNFPSRMLAYMEARLPLLIASDTVSDAGKLAAENGFGKWSQAGDIESFNENLNFYIREQLLCKEMGLKAYEYLLQNFSVRNSYQSIINACKHV